MNLIEVIVFKHSANNASVANEAAYQGGSLCLVINLVQI